MIEVFDDLIWFDAWINEYISLQDFSGQFLRCREWDLNDGWWQYLGFTFWEVLNLWWIPKALHSSKQEMVKQRVQVGLVVSLEISPSQLDTSCWCSPTRHATLMPPSPACRPRRPPGGAALGTDGGIGKELWPEVVHRICGSYVIILSSELGMAGMIQRLGRRFVWCTTRLPAGGLGESWQELWSFEHRSQSWVATVCKIQIWPSEENMTRRTARRWSFDASFGLVVLSSDLNLEFLTVQERELRTLGQHGPAEKARRTVSLSVLCRVEW